MGSWRFTNANEYIASPWTGNGNDLIYAEGGHDTVVAYAGNDVVDGGSGNDQLEGGYGNDDLFGNSGNDFIAGQEGNDTLCGGLGSDTLSGGGGYDTFLFMSAAAANGDWISGDYSPYWDMIDVSLIDAVQSTFSDEAFTFIGNVGFTAAGQLRTHYQGGNTYLLGNTDNDPSTYEFWIGVQKPFQSWISNEFNL